MSINQFLTRIGPSLVVILALTLTGNSMLNSVIATANLTSLHENSSLQEEKQKVEKDLIALLTKAINFGAEIIDVTRSNPEDNASLYIKLVVNST